jgi:hypothetical protein
MTNMLAVRARTRDPAHASARCRRAAEHYVKNGCKFIGPSLVFAGYSESTARDPRKNGYTHEWLVQVAGYYNRGAQATAKSHLADAIKVMADIMHDNTAATAARGTAAKVLIDVGTKEKEATEGQRDLSAEQAKWIAQIKHWKRTFLRRGIRMGLLVEGGTQHQRDRAIMLLDRLNYLLGKGACPAGYMDDGEEDGEIRSGLLGPEGGPRPEYDAEAEIVEEEPDAG